MTPPGVSVVVPTFNRAHVLGEALDSILQQGHPDVEVIVVDDGSTDATSELLDSYAALHGDNLVVIRQANAGKSAARNAGIAASKHELIAFLDSDNRWRPEKLSRQLALFEARPRTAFSFTGYSSFGTLMAETFVLAHWQPTPSFALEQLLVGCCINTSTVVAQKGVLVQAGLFDESLASSEDHDLWLRIALNGVEMQYIPAPLLEYRVHPDAASADEAAVAASSERVIERVFENSRLPAAVNARRRQHLARWYLNSAIRYIEASDAKRGRRALYRAAATRPASVRPGWLRLLWRTLS
jgi:glycosyltransferase involved in cell wall biosynthesis